jgi:hypothetical protein
VTTSTRGLGLHRRRVFSAACRATVATTPRNSGHADLFAVDAIKDRYLSAQARWPENRADSPVWSTPLWRKGLPTTGFMPLKAVILASRSEMYHEVAVEYAGELGSGSGEEEAEERANYLNDSLLYDPFAICSLCDIRTAASASARRRSKSIFSLKGILPCSSN